MKAFNYKAWTGIQKQIAGMSVNDGNRWIRSIYESGWNDCKKTIAPEDTDVYIWDEEQIVDILRRHKISDKRAREIMAEIEEERQRG